MQPAYTASLPHGHPRALGVIIRRRHARAGVFYDWRSPAASDVDLLVEFDRPVGYFGLFALQDHLESLLGCKVDLGTPGSLKPRIRERMMGECVRVA